MSAGQELLDGPPILLRTLRLEIRSIRPSALGTFVPIEPQPSKSIQYRPQCGFDVPLLIGIVNPQQKLTSCLLG
jgi:hypothetical protein